MMNFLITRIFILERVENKGTKNLYILLGIVTIYFKIIFSCGIIREIPKESVS